MTGEKKEEEATTTTSSSTKNTSNNSSTVKRESIISSVARRSSFFNNRRLSFFRSHGTRGANVSVLRGNTGATFEGYARVARCGDYMNCCGFKFGTVEESTKKPRFLLIKGNSLFVFANEDAAAPKYAIALANHTVEEEDHTQHLGSHHTDVLLKTSLGDVEYRFIFYTKENKDEVEKFMSAVKNASAEGTVENVKKELGHGHLLQKRASDAFANKVAEEKLKDQPHEPINVSEAMAAFPAAPYPHL